MKKTLRCALALVLALTCILSLVACAKPQTNLEKAKANLEAADYKVSYDTEPSDIGVAEKLTASKGLLDIISGDDDYIVIVKYETSKAAKLAAQSMKLAVEQQIEAKKLELKIEKNNKSQFDANNAEKIDDLEDAIEDLKEQLENIGRSGKYVWYGDDDAIKASKG